MKVEIKKIFDLPEERHEYMLDAHANILYSVVWDTINHKLRNEIKHGEHSDEVYKAYEDIREYMIDYLESEGINLNLFE